jgi:hypothetical protein
METRASITTRLPTLVSNIASVMLTSTARTQPKMQEVRAARDSLPLLAIDGEAVNVFIEGTKVDPIVGDYRAGGH